ncbi:RNA methyltransferase [Robiginitalea sp. 2V75]|uniref:RNA methyltransferase n=1 Tax=Robiginitalea marina TaxID=2954105 RepID=A0ABT1AY08_9FLAO|nr:RNA methyltransferase [Robiginitalea marina]MCO5724796.1 RNA methyltransferase [Robiginitalea marina]
MVAKKDLKFIKSLHQKKNRARHGLFLAEGVKLVGELLGAGFGVHSLYSTDPGPPGIQTTPISPGELKKVSTLVQPNKVLGVFEVPEAAPPRFNGWLLALDGVRDPGNLGTIIRLCDWFGVRDLLCSPDTVDCYNPKTLMATMGSIARVRVHYLPLEEVLPACGLPVYGASMEGNPLPGASLPAEGVLVLGSESHGVSAPVRALLRATLAIPTWGDAGAESLNVGTAAGIFLYEIRRGTPGPTIQK